MSAFSAGWLDRREPVDVRSRAGALGAFFASQRFETRPTGEGRPVIDLGAGTGSNLRYLAPVLTGKQDWLLVEQDESLLRVMPERMRAWAEANGGRFRSEGDAWRLQGPGFDCRIRTRPLNLATELDQLILAQGALVTASALFDLVSEAWLVELIARCADADASIWFALTFDGRCPCRPVDPWDAKVAALFLAHQRTDKGFGPALGPQAAARIPEILARFDYRTRGETSDWRLGSEDREFQRHVLQGWFEAACEAAPVSEPELRLWLERRLAWIEHGDSEMIIGHVDVVGWKS